MPEPPPVADPTPPHRRETPEPSGARRLLSALTGRPNRRQLIAAVLLALLGYAAAVQIQLTHASNDFAGQRRDDLVELLDSLSGASDRAEQQISELQNARDLLLSSTTRSSRGDRRRPEAARRPRDPCRARSPQRDRGSPSRSRTLTTRSPPPACSTASRSFATRGRRRSRSTTPSGFVQSSWISGGPGRHHDRRAPGAARRTSSDAIGSAHTLSEAVGFPGGLADEISSLGGHVTVQEQTRSKIDALHPVDQPQYSHPTGQ